MRKMINHEIYDIETSNQLHRWATGYEETDLLYREKILYQTKEGNFFLYHFWTEPIGTNNVTTGCDIDALSKADAIDFLMVHNGAEVLTVLFPNMVEPV